MARLNVRPVATHATTHEGGRAMRITPEQELRRSVMACLLWESTFYENGVAIADRIASLIPHVPVETVCEIAFDARIRFKLRHVPLLIAREMARIPSHKDAVESLLPRIIQRPDELAEFLAIYWKDGKCPISKKVKLGLAASFARFDEYQFAKYNRDGAIRLRDVMFMTHPRPIIEGQGELYKKLAEDKLAVPDTWEVALSAGADKKVTWERLMKEEKLGALALLRNLRNMAEAKVDEPTILHALEDMKVERVLPFRFIAAAKAAPQWETHIEVPMFKCLAGLEKLPGRTVLLVDVSGSMDSSISAKSDLMRMDAACGLAILARELCEDVAVYSFSNDLKRVPDRRGFALRDAIVNSMEHNGTNLGGAVDILLARETYDRMIVLTDEQAHDRVRQPYVAGRKHYMINVSVDENGVGYGAWIHIDGWSEACLAYIEALEGQPLEASGE
jgi:60 kDa SS-A/Ro ribonucleoprotein